MSWQASFMNRPQSIEIAFSWRTLLRSSFIAANAAVDLRINTALAAIKELPNSIFQEKQPTLRWSGKSPSICAQLRVGSDVEWLSSLWGKQIFSRAVTILLCPYHFWQSLILLTQPIHSLSWSLFFAFSEGFSNLLGPHMLASTQISASDCVDGKICTSQKHKAGKAWCGGYEEEKNAFSCLLQAGKRNFLSSYSRNLERTIKCTPVLVGSACHIWQCVVKRRKGAVNDKLIMDVWVLVFLPYKVTWLILKLFIFKTMKVFNYYFAVGCA